MFDNFILDIEKKLWEYYELEPTIKSGKSFEKLIGDEPTIIGLRENRKVISDIENPVLKAVNKIINTQNLSTKFVVLEDINEHSNSIMSCFSSPDCSYIYYHSFFLETFNEVETLSIVAHEIGHSIFLMPVNPANYTDLFAKFYASDRDSLFRFITLSHILTHLNEYNADRYSFFVTHDINIYEDCFNKQDALVHRIFPGQSTEKEISEFFSQGWQYTFTFKHPTLKNRLEALRLVADRIYASDFNVNKEPQMRQKLEDLVSYNKFMESYGKYYEDLKMKS
ncbi:MAG TPA: hypothetical protein PKW80_00725 [Bacteroidales bacterium]|nr:hypothetical protein [Bacteroidales bacterium]